ncbi:MAG TPA: AAA family ATPase, partial [Pyrodictium sp.]|nr:AAA family ATPase [Pyrodictium sp.]
MSIKEIRLEVAEARQRDVGRKIARIGREVMRELGVEVGDFIEIEGPKGIAIAQVWPLPPGDSGKRIIRIDGFIREAIGAGVGD